MTLNPGIWYPIAGVLCVANLVGVWFAARPAQLWHATLHAMLALGFGLWAQRLHARSRAAEGAPAVYRATY